LLAIGGVKQLRKSQGKFTGGLRAFGYDVIDGVQEPREDEQVGIREMVKMREAGSSLLAIHRWLTVEKGVKLAYSSMRVAILG
jgi:hypothetical protein